MMVLVNGEMPVKMYINNMVKDFKALLRSRSMMRDIYGNGTSRAVSEAYLGLDCIFSLKLDRFSPLCDLLSSSTSPK